MLLLRLLLPPLMLLLRLLLPPLMLLLRLLLRLPTNLGKQQKNRPSGRFFCP